MSTNHKHASTYHKKKIHIRNIITFIIIVLCHAFWIFRRVSFIFLRIEIIFIHEWLSNLPFPKKMKKIVIYLILIIMVLLCQSRFPHLVSKSVKVSTPCQGFHALFLCKSRFPHLAKVSTPCFYESRFPHLAMVSTPCF